MARAAPIRAKGDEFHDVMAPPACRRKNIGAGELPYEALNFSPNLTMSSCEAAIVLSSRIQQSALALEHHEVNSPSRLFHSD